MHHSDIATLYAREHTWLCGWLRRQLGDRDKAADLAHDVFLRLLQRTRPLDIHEPRTFLATVARGLLCDLWRREQLEKAWLETLAHLPQSYAPSPEEQFLVMETLLQLDRMLAGLKPRQRQVFLLAQIDGLNCPQIAKALKISIATVERHIASALRACYQAQFEA